MILTTIFNKSKIGLPDFLLHYLLSHTDLPKFKACDISFMCQYELASIAVPDLCALWAQLTVQIRAHPARSDLTQSELELPLSFTCHPPPTLSLRGGGLLRLS